MQKKVGAGGRKSLVFTVGCYRQKGALVPLGSGAQRETLIQVVQALGTSNPDGGGDASQSWSLLATSQREYFGKVIRDW